MSRIVRSLQHVGRHRWRYLPVLAAAVVPLVIVSDVRADPPEDSGLFELDKNAQNDVTTTFLGSLGGNINATATSFTVCQAGSANPATPITIQVEAEQMTVGAIANAGGGGCQNSFKRTYSSVTRGVNGTTAAAHGASGVSGFVTQVVTGPVPGNDWDEVFDAVEANPDATNPCSGLDVPVGAAITACDWEHDPDGETIFVQGGSKDDLNITEWRHADGSVPDADDITDGFAAKYDGTDGHQYLFFGADRTAVNGAKDLGFWFFKSPVSLNEDGTFNGVHTVGDILVLSTFTQGGAATTIRVFSWVGTGGNTNNTLQTEGLFGDCVPGRRHRDGCATVNNSTIQSPWAYQSKISGSPADTLFAGGFMEGGVDLSDLGLTGCFTNFLVETRSSPEIGAQLKDFLIGEFEACEAALVTTPADGAGVELGDSDGDDLPDIQIGTGSAGVDVTDQADLTIDGTDTWSGTLHFFLCGPIATGTCDSGGLEIGTGTAVDQDTPQPVVSDSANLTSVGRYCWRGFFDSDTLGVDDSTDASEGECFEVLPVTPSLTTVAREDVILGNPVTDDATLGGTAYQPGTNGPDATYTSINADMVTPANGTITFTLFGPGDCTTVATNPNSPTTNPQDVTVIGDGVYTASFTPAAIGEYTWVANYSGDSPNTNPFGPTACPDANEAVIVSETLLTTEPANAAGDPLVDSDGDDLPDIQIGTGADGVDVTDSADLTVNGVADWSGTLHFFLCGPIDTGTCDSGGLEIGTGTPVDQDTPQPVVSGTAHLTSVGRYCWRGFFDSDTTGVGDQTDASEGECFEVLPVTPSVTTVARRGRDLGQPDH